MFYLAALLLSAALVALLASPALRPPKPARPEADARGTLAPRLAGIEQDSTLGLLDAAGAEEAAVEAKRAALDAAGAAPGGASRNGRLAAVAAAGLAPLAAAWIYLAIGAPDLAQKSRAELRAEAEAAAETAIAQMPEQERQAMIEGMVAGLAARLADNPEDADGWRMLARSYGVLGRHEESASAWQELFRRAEGDESDWRGYADALLALGPGDGRESEVDRAMDRLLALNPDQPMALYFAGARAQREGDPAAAVRHWRRLLGVLPQDAPVRPAIENLIAEAGGASETVPE